MKAQVKKTAFRTGFTRHDVARPGRGEAVSSFDHSLSRRPVTRKVILDFGFRVFSRGSIFLLALPLLLLLLALPLGAQTPTPTPPPTVSISGTVTYCSNPTLPPLPGVTMTLSGTSSGSTTTNGAGFYTFTGLVSGGSYTVTPTKAALPPGSIDAGINTVDVVAIVRYLLHIPPPLTGCRLAAADVNSIGGINVVDIIAMQRFLVGLSTGIANTGKYQFNPTSRTYMGIVTDQTNQNYDALVFGDVASPFADLAGGLSQDGTSANEVPATVAAVALPEVAVDAFVTNFITQVTTTTIDAKNKLVGFQGDLNFDERVVTFESQPVQNAGLTGGNWNVSGNVLDGPGPIRTLRISAYSNDFTPLSGSGALFELRMTRVSKAAQRTQLIWAAPPNEFIFIDAELNTQKPGYAGSGSVTQTGKRK